MFLSLVVAYRLSGRFYGFGLCRPYPSTLADFPPAVGVSPSTGSLSLFLPVTAVRSRKATPPS